MFIRDARDSRPTDQEEWYECECGFGEFISGTCGCDECRKYREKNGWPLTCCPDCGRPVDEVRR